MTRARTNAVNYSADISGVTAGTGLSGGGNSGSVTVSLDTTSVNNNASLKKSQK